MRLLPDDIAFAFRSYARTPALSLFAIAMLAAGIGIATTTYSVVESVLIRSLPFHEPDRLIDIKVVPLELRASRRGGATISDRWRLAARGHGPSLDAIAGFTGRQPVLTGMGDPERISTWSVESNFFPVLGVSPLLGRGPLPEEDRPGSEPVAVLSHAFWTTRFGADPAAVGRTLVLDGRPVEIVGVMPSAMRYPAETAAWLSLGWTMTSTAPTGREVQGRFWMVGRLAPGVSIAGAHAELDLIARRLVEQGAGPEGWSFTAMPLHDQLVGATRTPLLVMLGAVGFVLLVAGANVANLLLARTVARRREIAIRGALGAGRGRIVRQFLVESVLLSVAGGTLGVVLALWMVPWVVGLAGAELPGIAEVGVNRSVLAAAVIAMVGTGLLFGIAPAARAARELSTDALRAGSVGAGGGSWRSRATATFLVVQIAVAMVLLAGAGLLGASFARLVRVDPGFEAEGVLTALVRLPSSRYPDSAAQMQFAGTMLERVAALPAVRAASVSSGVPLAAGAIGSWKVEDRDDWEEEWAAFASVTPDHFRTLGIPHRRGRMFTGAPDDADAIVVSEALVRRAFPGEDPIGRRVTVAGGRTRTIIGVVGATRERALDQPAPPTIYHALAASPSSYLTISARTAGDPARLSIALRGAVREADPLLPVDRLTTMRAMVAESIARQRFYATLLGVFAATALLVAATGVFGVVLFTVTQRTHELGVRLALGASPGVIVSLVVRRAALQAALGIVLGSAGAYGATRVLGSLLYELRPGEPIVLLAVGALLGGIALCASWLPARRAARIPPTRALQAE